MQTDRFGSLGIVLVLVVAAFGAGCGGSRGGSSADSDYLDDARLLRNPEEIPAAIEWTQLQASLQPDEPYWPHREAELSAMRGANGEMAPALRAALDLDPIYAPSLTLLSKTYYEEGRFEEAIGVLEPALEAMEAMARLTSRADAGTSAVAAALALHYEAIGEYGSCDALVERYADRGSEWATIGSTLTYLTLRGDGYRLAEPRARQALDADESSAENLNNYGVTRLLHGDPEEAQRYFERALELDSELPGPLYNLAIVSKFYFFEEDSAQAYFDRYIELSDEDPDGLREFFVPESAGNVTLKGGTP